MTVRVAQQAGEVLLTGNPTARVAQQAAEVLLTPGTPKARAAQQAVEVLRSTWDAYNVTVAIANPGAESADAGNEPSSWTETSGDWESVANIGGDFPIASAQEGRSFSTSRARWPTPCWSRRSSSTTSRTQTSTRTAWKTRKSK